MTVREAQDHEWDWPPRREFSLPPARAEFHRARAPVLTAGRLSKAFVFVVKVVVAVPIAAVLLASIWFLYVLIQTA